jgi:hypothetical protein
LRALGREMTKANDVKLKKPDKAVKPKVSQTRVYLTVARVVRFKEPADDRFLFPCTSPKEIPGKGRPLLKVKRR